MAFRFQRAVRRAEAGRERQMTAMEERRMNDTRLAARVIAEVKKVIVGKDEVLIKMLLAILAGGHILLEDIPGGRQDDDGAGFFPGAGASLRPRAVYAGCHAV